MLKLIFYAFTQGIYSMRELSDKYLTKHIDYIYLSGNQYIDHSTFSLFINLYMEEIIEIFTTTVYVANNLGFVGKDLIALDGCKIKANASKKFTGNYETFTKKKETYKKMIENLLERTKRYDEKSKANNIEKTIIEKEKNNIERLKESYRNTLDKITDFLKNTKEEDKKKKINLIDKDSALMMKAKRIIQGYNSQVSMSNTGIIVSTDINGLAADQGQLETQMANTKISLSKAGLSETEIKSIKYLVDKGYVVSSNIGNLVRAGYDMYIKPKEYNQEIKPGEKISSKHCKIYKENDKYYLECPGEQKIITIKTRIISNQICYEFKPDWNKCKICKYYNICISDRSRNRKKIFYINKDVFDNFEELEGIRKKLKQFEGKDIYNKRLWLGEFAWGVITEQKKFKKLLVKGIEKVKTHWNIVCGAFNIKKIWLLSMRV